MSKTDSIKTGDINCAGNPRKRALSNTVEWNEIDWSKVEKSVFKLQKRIYQASKNDNVRKLRRLQKTLLNSYHAKLIAVRWCNYYRTVCSKDTYSKVNQLLFYKLIKWGYRRHPNKSKTWTNKKYWRTIGMNNWRFACKAGEINYILLMHPETKIIRHTKVKGEASPYDGNNNYWASRMGKHPEVKSTIARLLKKQKGKCNYCELTFKPEDKIERDHIIPRQAGGNKLKDNLQLIHKHCHDVKTKTDLITIKRYKIRKGWKKVYKKYQNQFEKSKWIWNNDLPTLV